MTEKGQSSTEYILLLLVVIAMVSAVFTNDKFRKFFGNDSEFFTVIKQKMEYSYQYCTSGVKDSDTGEDYGKNHASYYNTETSETRFFAPKDKYPQ